MYELTSGDLDELASMRVATCHRMADFWRAMDELPMSCQLPPFRLRTGHRSGAPVPQPGVRIPHQRAGLLPRGPARLLKRHPNPRSPD